MKNILCYGDSNTFGYNPQNGLRLDKNSRWSSILADKLENEYNVIEAGLCDRTAFVDNSKGHDYSAQRHYPDFLSKFRDLSIIIIALGTNDLQFLYEINEEIVKKGLTSLIKLSKEFTDNIIIVSPVKLNNEVLKGYFKIQFDEKSVEKSKKIGAIYKKICTDECCIYFDINEFAQPSNHDGLHYEPNTHRHIAQKLYELIQNSNQH